jgi:hypothetical protein
VSRADVARRLRALGVVGAAELAILAAMPGMNGQALLQAIDSGEIGMAPARGTFSEVVASLPGRILTGEDGEFLGHRIVGSGLTAEQVFARMAVLGHAGSPDPITFHCPQGSCQARAQIMVEHLQELGLSPLKAWALSEAMAIQQPLEGYPVRALQPVKEDGTPLLNEEGRPTVWSFHVAPAFEVQRATGGRQVLVLDPSLARGPITLEEWHHRVGTPEGAYFRHLTPWGQAPIDPFTGRPFPGTGYWLHREGDPPVGAGPHARDAMADLAGRFPLPPL